MDNAIKNKVLNYIEENKEKLFKILSELININSENFGTNGNEKEMAEHVAKRLDALGAKSDVYPPDSIPGFTDHFEYLAGRNTDKRPNVTGVLRGESGKKPIMFTAHIDTMPIGDESLWSINPLGGEIKNGRIYGRGACDDKYAVATVLFVMEALRDLGITLSNDLYFTGYCDEEFGGGNGALAACLKYPCDVYVNLDCKNMRIWNCAVGGRREKLTLIKDEAAITVDDMIDAVSVAKEELHKFGENRRRELSENPNFDGTNIPNQSMRILCMQSGLNTNDRNCAHIDFSYYTDKTEAEIKLELSALAERINALADDGVIKGTTATTYSPANNITRADFALLLVRAFELSSDNTENFADVSASDYFASELAIARNTGIVNGIGDNKYAPRNTITRQDMMVIVYRALNSLPIEEKVSAELTDEVLSQYPDFDTVADYAKEAVNALVGAGLVNGKSGRIAPTDYTTRAEVAVLIKRILDHVSP